jgi:N utilization substance protein B
MLRPESKTRARALQLLCAWDLQDQAPLRDVASRTIRLCRRGGPQLLERAEDLAQAVVQDVDSLDRLAAGASENWRLDRLGVVERNILRLGIRELTDESVMPDPTKSAKVIIDEAVRLAHWFGPLQSPGFINGVLDQIARSQGRL